MAHSPLRVALALGLRAVAARRPPARQLQGQPARLRLALGLPRPVRRLAVRRADRQRPAAAGPLRRPLLLPGPRRLSRDRLRRLLRDRGRLRRPRRAGADRGARLDRLAADPLQLRHRRPRPAAARRPRRRPRQNWLGTDDQARDVLARVIYGFRISVLFGLAADRCSARSSASPPARCRAISAAGSIWLPALHGDLGRAADPLSPDHHVELRRARLLDAADPDAAVQLDGPGRRRARRVPARAQPRLRPRRAGAGRRRRARSCSATSCPTPWSRP